MTTETARPDDDPRHLLAGARDLARRVRSDQRATWFPLLVLAAVTFAIIPVLRFTNLHVLSCVHGSGREACGVYRPAAPIFWPAALTLAYVAIAAFYLRRSRARGVGSRVRPYVIAGVVLAVAITGISLVGVYDPQFASTPWGLSWLRRPLHGGLLGYQAGIGAALLVLAWAERNRPLLALIVAYFVSIVLAHDIVLGLPPPRGLSPRATPATLLHVHPSPGVYLTYIIPGSVLLLGGVGFLLAQRPWRHPA